MKKLTIYFLFIFIAQTISYNVLGQAAFLDPSFGGTGVVKQNFGPLEIDEYKGIAIQPDKKIIAVGRIHGTASAVRFLPNGSIDSSFGIYGFYNGPTYSQAYAITIQPDGKIILMGTVSDWTHDALLTIRLSNNGIPDSTFGTYGIASTGFGLWGNNGYAIALQTDGKIVIAGDNSTSLCVARLLPNGTLDNTFGDTGVVITDYLFPGSAKGVHVMPDGRIVASGTIKPHYYLAALRLLPNGQFDTSFNHTGIAMTLAGDSYDMARGSVVLPDGKVVVGGGGTFGSQGYDMTLVCFNTDGSLNHFFGDTGVAHLDFDKQDDEVFALTLTPDNKITAAGYCTTNKQTIGLAQFDLQGKPDSSFGVYGKIETPISDSMSSALGVAVQADGKVVVVGSYHNTYSQPILARYKKVPTQISEHHPSAGPLFYPNPATDQLFVDTRKKPSSINAFNLLGQSEPVLYDRTSGLISVGNFAPGSYLFVAFYDDRACQSQMVLIQH